jgi:hypothetical protein
VRIRSLAVDAEVVEEGAAEEVVEVAAFRVEEAAAEVVGVVDSHGHRVEEGEAFRAHPEVAEDFPGPQVAEASRVPRAAEVLPGHRVVEVDRVQSLEAAHGLRNFLRGRVEVDFHPVVSALAAEAPVAHLSAEAHLNCHRQVDPVVVDPVVVQAGLRSFPLGPEAA